MTTLTAVVVAVVVYGVVNRRGYAVALGLGGATPVGAALAAGDTAVPTFYAVAIGAAVGLVLRVLQRTRADEPEVARPFPGSTPLVLLVVVAVLVTLVAPYLFDGMITHGSDGAIGHRLSAGLVTSSNTAQIIYLVLGVSVVAFLAHARWTGPQVVGLATGTATLLSLWAWLGTTAGVPFPTGFFDNSPAFNYIATLPGGAPRVRGIFSEPAGLAISCLVTTAYATSRATQVTGARRAGALALVAVALFLGSISTSATFFVAGVALVAVAAAVAGISLLVRQQRLGTGVVVAACAAALAGLWLLPVVVGVVEGVVDDKVGSSSFDERSTANADSLGYVLDTWGFGVGLGANRASSFLPSLLSTVGVVGAVLFVAAVWVLLAQGTKVREARPAAWALVAALVCKAISGPDLSDSSGVLWLSLGVLAHAAVQARRLRETGGALTDRVQPVASRDGRGLLRG